MKTEHKNFRDKLLYDLWEEKKGELSMDFLAQIFKISLGQAHRIIKDKVPIIGKIVPDKKLGNKIVWKK